MKKEAKEAKWGVLGKEEVEWTVERAKARKALAKLPGERPLHQSHVDYIVGEVKRGNFSIDNVTLADVKVGTKVYSVNGQHTSEAKVGLGDATMRGRVTVVHYWAADMDAAAQIYATFDPRTALRSKRQIMHSIFANNPTYGKYHDHALHLVANAAAFVQQERSKGMRDRMPPAEIAHAIERYRPECLEVLDIIKNETDSNHLRRDPVVCAMLVTFRKSAAAAREFWTAVRDGENLKKKDPRKLLENRLREMRSRMVGPINKKMPRCFAAFYHICMHMWNAWRSGSDRTVLKFTAGTALPEAA